MELRHISVGILETIEEAFNKSNDFGSQLDGLNKLLDITQDCIIRLPTN